MAEPQELSLEQVNLRLAQLQDIIDKSRANIQLVSSVADEKSAKKIDVVKLFQNVGPEELPVVRIALAKALVDSGDLAAAEEQYRNAVDEFRKRGASVDEADASAGLARVLKENSKFSEAEQAYLTAISIHSRLGQEQKALPLMKALSELYRVQGKTKEAEVWMARSANAPPSDASAPLPVSIEDKQPRTPTGSAAPPPAQQKIPVVRPTRAPSFQPPTANTKTTDLPPP